MTPEGPAGTRPPDAGRTGVLFDIDGTLLDTGGAGRRSFIRALEAVFGWRDRIPYVRFAGNTDLNVLQQVMAAHGAECTETARRAFFAALPGELEREAAGADLVLYPGVRELLERLSAEPSVVLGLVTGNIEPCARIKLRQFDLHGHFTLGAFGDEHADRALIARMALGRLCQAAGGPLREVFLIGDTPSDIAAARAIGARSLAVATGAFGSEALREAGADRVFTDLSDTESVMRSLGVEAAAAGAV